MTENKRNPASSPISTPLHGRKKASKVLETSKSNPYSVLDLIPGFVLLQGADFSIRFANRSFIEIFGEPAGRPCYKILHGFDAPCESCNTLKVLQTGQPQTWEWSHSNGYTYLVNDDLFVDDKGELLVMEVGMDITDRKRMENQMLFKEQQFRMVADFTFDWEYWQGIDGRMIYNSPSCQRITGRPNAEFIRNPSLLLDIVHPEDHEMVEKHFHDEQADSDIYSLDFRIITTSGELRWIGHACQPVYDSAGKSLGRRASNRDITERKYAEQALLQAEKMATIGRLTASLAHEINNPLQAICNSIELIMDFPLPEEERATYMLSIRQDIERLMSITSDILDFARPRASLMVSTRVSEVLQKALNLADRQRKLNHVSTQVYVPENLPLVNASPEQLEQVFLNLIINAIDQMPAGGLLTVYGTHENGEISVSFADTGTGIPPESLDMIFEPFYTTKRTGTGLGLSISQKYIKEHGGRITARNLEKGAVFTVCLPVHKT